MRSHVECRISSVVYFDAMLLTSAIQGQIPTVECEWSVFVILMKTLPLH